MNAEDKAKALELSVALCKRFEGFVAHPYLCPACVPTIGYGCTRYPDGVKVTLQDKPITEERAVELLRVMLQRFQDGVLASCPAIKSPALLAACTDLAYNIGLNAFGSSTLRKVINDGGDNAAISAQFRRWNKAGGAVLAGLTKRREAEIALFSA